MKEEEIIEKTVKFFHDIFYVGIDDWGDTVVICDKFKDIDEIIKQYKEFLNED